MSRRLLCLAVATLGLGHACLAPAAGAQAVPDPFELRSPTAGCAQATGFTAVRLAPCAGSAAQRWARPGDGTVRALGRCLDVVGGGTAEGTRVQLWPCNGTAAQQWQATEDGALLNPGSGRCLDAAAPPRISTCGDAPGQDWMVPPLGGRTGGPAGTCVDVPGGLAYDGAGVRLWACNGSAAQHWVRPGDGTLRVLGRCLDVRGGVGPRVQLWRCNGTDAQVWEPYHGNVLINRATTGCLTVAGREAGRPVHVAACAGGELQSWWPLAYNEG